MKKFLFTLASLVAFGFAANAGVPTFAFAEPEVTMGAGQVQEFKIQLTSIDEAIKAADWTFEMVDPDGNLMTDKVKLQYLQKYGSRVRYQFFGKTGIAVDNEVAYSTSDGQHATNDNMTITGVYKLIMAQTSSNICFYEDEATPTDIALFTVEVEEGWDAEYAELRMTKGTTMMVNAGEIEIEHFSMRINNADYVAPQPIEPAPVPTFVEENGQVAAVCEGHEVVLMLDGSVVANPYTLPEQTDEEQVLNFSAYTVANADESGNSATVDYQVIIPAKENPQTLTGEIEIGEVDAEGYITINYTGDEDVTITVTVDGVEVPVVDGKVNVGGEGEHVVVVTVSGEGYETMTEQVTVTYEPETPPTPDHTYQLVLVHNDGTEEIVDLMLGSNGDYIEVVDLTYPTYHYVARFYFLIDGKPYGADADETEAYLGDADFNPLNPNNNLYYVNVGFSYTIGIHFIYDQDTLEFMGYSAYVAKGGPTDVEELNADKAIAGVRYFNMAGQEMQEANGMTIVVTTYTDGTTSAVKVMK
jgi:hypothetical protein